MAEMYGKAGERLFRDTRCRASSMRRPGGHAIVGAGLPVAVGLAIADALTRRARVTACFGDGAVAEGGLTSR